LARYPALDVVASDADLVLAAVDECSPTAVQERDGAFTLYFGDRRSRDRAQALLFEAFPTARVSPREVDDENWAQRSQESLGPIAVGRVTVAPPWAAPAAIVAAGTEIALGSPRPLLVVIKPSMGFGTGHHATTRLCLRLLQDLELRGARAVDVGTGSGVLALAAWKLGASDVVAIDHDPDALSNARDNIARNGGAAAIDIICDDLNTLKIEPADVVLANLTAAVLVRYSTPLRRLSRGGGYMILSGFAPAHLTTDIQPAFEATQQIRALVERDWAAVCLRRL
jgi:ribosomal protein L11 methyltransferase